MEKNILDKYQWLFEEVIAKYGKEAQVDMIAEEALELALAVRKFKRHAGTKEEIERLAQLIDEVADMKIMIKQTEIMLGEKIINDQVKFKIARLHNRINENKITNLNMEDMK